MDVAEKRHLSNHLRTTGYLIRINLQVMIAHKATNHVRIERKCVCLQAGRFKIGVEIRISPMNNKHRSILPLCLHCRPLTPG